jgi:hypothetical protein
VNGSSRLESLYFITRPKFQQPPRDAVTATFGTADSFESRHEPFQLSLSISSGCPSVKFRLSGQIPASTQ